MHVEERAAHHLQFDLDTQTLLLHSSHTCGEGLPHARGSTQGQLGASLQTCNRPRQHCGPTRAAQKQTTDVLPVGKTERPAAVMFMDQKQKKDTDHTSSEEPD